MAIVVPAIVTQERYDLVQAKLAHNQQTARRHNTHYQYLLRGLINCGYCHLTTTARTTAQGNQYYACRGRSEALRVAEGRACRARYIPAQQLDAVVWHDLCTVLMEPALVAEALQRALLDTGYRKTCKRGGPPCSRGSSAWSGSNGGCWMRISLR